MKLKTTEDVCRDLVDLLQYGIENHVTRWNDPPMVELKYASSDALAAHKMAKDLDLVRKFAVSMAASTNFEYQNVGADLLYILDANKKAEGEKLV